MEFLMLLMYHKNLLLKKLAGGIIYWCKNIFVKR